MSVQMDKNEKIEKLIDFINEYAEDFLEDGTKDYVIEKLENGDMKFALDIMNCMNKEWVERTKEIKKFYLFTDVVKFDSNGNLLKNPYYRSSYMDSTEEGISNVPALREVRPMGIIDTLRRTNIFFDDER